VVVLDPLLAAIFLLLTVWCIIRLAVSVWVYHDASELGRDAMGWMGLVCVLGLLGLIVWLVVRPKSRYPYSYQIPYYQKAPPGQMYQMQYHPVPQPYSPQNPEQPPPPRQAREPMGPETPREPEAPKETATPKETSLPQPAPSSGLSKAIQGAPVDAAGPQVAQMHPPPGYIYVDPRAQWRLPQLNPYSVRRMIATFVAAIAFANYIVTPIMLVWILQLPSLNIDTLMTDILTPEMTLLATAVQDGLLLYFTWLVMFRHKYLSLPGLGLKRDGRTAGLIALGLLAGLALFAVNYAVSWPIEQSGIAGGSQSIFDMRGRPWGLLMIGLATVVIAPVTEEVFFRGYALATVERKWGPGAGILLSALIFAAVHLSIVSLLPIFAIGILLAMLCRKFGLIPCIMAHAVNNLLAVVLIYLGYG
jgi:membrane protease YdiL (CAAX protease family)